MNYSVQLGSTSDSQLIDDQLQQPLLSLLVDWWWMLAFIYEGVNKISLLQRWLYMCRPNVTYSGGATRAGGQDPEKFVSVGLMHLICSLLHLIANKD